MTAIVVNQERIQINIIAAKTKLFILQFSKIYMIMPDYHEIQ